MQVFRLSLLRMQLQQISLGGRESMFAEASKQALDDTYSESQPSDETEELRTADDTESSYVTPPFLKTNQDDITVDLKFYGLGAN